MKQQQNEPNHQNFESFDDHEDEVDLLFLAQALGEAKWPLLGIPFLCACIAALISLYLTPMYTAKATFVVPDKQSSNASAVLDQLGGVGGLAGSLSKSPTDMYVAFMQSNTVQDMLIVEFDLMQRYQTKTKEDTRSKFSSLVKISTDKKSGLITIQVQDQSPDIAANIANAYLKPFRIVLNRMFLEEAHLRRDFFAQQIDIISQRPFRDPFAQSTLMNSMIKQYEAARIDQARESQILFPVDIANIPDRKSSPKRAQLVLTVSFVAFFLTLLWIIIKRVLQRSQNNPLSFQRWDMIKKAWKLRS